MSERNCDGCGRSNGHIRVYQSKGTEFNELWLCDRCAKMLGVESEEPAFGPVAGELLGALIGETVVTACPGCGTKFKTIRQTGRVGCAECYRTFRGRIHQLLEQEGLSGDHVGRYPARLSSFKRLLVDKESLRVELEDAIDQEDYETAATLRDRMQRLEDPTDEGV